jgi:hypothetical protein
VTGLFLNFDGRPALVSAAGWAGPVRLFGFPALRTCDRVDGCGLVVGVPHIPFGLGFFMLWNCHFIFSLSVFLLFSSHPPSITAGKPAGACLLGNTILIEIINTVIIVKNFIPLTRP